MKANSLLWAASLLAMMPIPGIAQVRQNPDPVVLKHWAAPLYWQPRAAGAGSQPLDPNPLVFVALTPCRVVDTRASQGFPPAFGPPSLVAGASRTFPVQSSASCPIPAAAQAYSFNFTVVPAGPSGFITAYPTGQPVPLAATLVWSGGSLTSNAAIVLGGTNGSIDVYANVTTDIVIDINGYYAPGGFGAGNIALGSGALSSNTTGTNNVGVGDTTLGANTTGSLNTALGDGAAASNAVGDADTAVGSGALHFDLIGGNTAVGYRALYANTTGPLGTAIGISALQSNTTGQANTAGGAGALEANTVGSNNTAYGTVALTLNTVGNSNVAYGQGALMQNTTGSNNIAIGRQAAADVSAANSNNIHIGSLGTSSDNGVIRIGDAQSQGTFFAAGIRGATTSINDAVPVVIDSNGQLGTVNSSRRFKEDIQDMGDASRGILRLRPVTFRYQKPFDDGSKPIQYGLIAEEVADVFPDLVARSADGQIETVKYQVLDSLLLNEVERQQLEITSQKDQILGLKEKILGLKEQIEQLKAAFYGSK
jgi:hypothetical protein